MSRRERMAVQIRKSPARQARRRHRYRPQQAAGKMRWTPLAWKTRGYRGRYPPEVTRVLAKYL